MALEDLTGASKFIDDLVNTNPAGGDAPTDGDGHIRGVKNVLLNTFPNITAAMTVTAADLNGFFASGNKMLFQQTAAPTGWTKDATHNDKGLRVVSGTASSGGTDSFSTSFSSSKATDSYTLTVTDIPSHNHGGATGSDGAHKHNLLYYTSGKSGSANTYILDSGVADDTADAAADFTHSSDTVSTAANHTHTVSSQGGGGGHSHTIAIDLEYVDVIIASKD